MSFIGVDKFGRSELYSEVSGKNNLQEKTIDEVNRSQRDYTRDVKLNLTKIIEQSELLQKN